MYTCIFTHLHVLMLHFNIITKMVLIRHFCSEAIKIVYVTVQWVVYSFKCILYTEYSVYCILYTEYSVYCILSTVYTAYCILSTVYTAYCIVFIRILNVYLVDNMYIYLKYCKSYLNYVNVQSLHVKLKV